MLARCCRSRALNAHVAAQWTGQLFDDFLKGLLAPQLGLEKG